LVCKILAASAAMEGATGALLILDPIWVVALLFGVEASGVAVALGRIAGIALLGLALACWPEREVSGGTSAPRALLVYNALAAIYLAYLGLGAHLAGVLLWPAFAEHLVVASLLVAAR
jgi:hypothetical protein